MRKPLVPDALGETIEPVAPPEPPRPTGGFPCVPDRARLTGIVFVVVSGIRWALPAEMGAAPG